MRYGYLSPKLEPRPCTQKDGMGIFAAQPIARGELLCVWGGRAVPKAEFVSLPAEQKNHSLQVEEEIYLVTDADREEVDYFNHSCDPNAGLAGQICLVAMRGIAIDEEVCFDYAMSDGSDYDEFVCACGCPKCRSVVRGSDWQMEELQERYAPYFSPYLQQRIAKNKEMRRGV